ncbi:hypothetical protein ANRL3_00766 [Anaerolineae bacterium]|nr:hypothetical protein ANRL3_00766 [Anaerolineae bacterium]
MRMFRYKGIRIVGVIVLHIGGLAAITIFTSFGCWVLFLTIQNNPSSLSTASCLAIWSGVWGWLIGLTMINFYPTVWTDKDGLTISAFFFKRIFVPWTDIVDVGAGHVPFGNVLVRARRITQFHRIYSWLYSRTLFPGFVISRNIEDYEELAREIRRKSQTIY